MMNVEFWQYEVGMAIACAFLAAIVTWLLIHARTSSARHRVVRNTTVLRPLPEIQSEVRFADAQMAHVGRSRDIASISEVRPHIAERLGYYDEVMRNLESAFDLLAVGRINLDTYRSLVVAEERAINLRIYQLTGMGPEEFRSSPTQDIIDSETAQAFHAIQWCLTWAADIGISQHGSLSTDPV